MKSKNSNLAMHKKYVSYSSFEYKNAVMNKLKQNLLKK